MPYTPIRFIVKKGSKETLTITFETTNLPSGSLVGSTIDWAMKRTITQTNRDLYKSTTNGSSELEIISDSQCNVYLEAADTTNLVVGDYYWACKVTNAPANLLAISPDTQHGDLILLDSAIV